MVESLRNLRRPVVVVAFEGWNDASDAASEALSQLAAVYDASVVDEIDSEEYYDYTTARPMITKDETGRHIEWPAVEISVAHMPSRDLVLVIGPEPNLRWRSFANLLVSALRSVNPDLVVLLGAMLTDAPHSRPTPVSVTTGDRRWVTRLGLDESDYEGPTGVLGVLSEYCSRAGMPNVSIWASVPHYVANPPNPKATLALLLRLEDLLDEAVDVGDLPDQAREWEKSVNELVGEDPDIREYVEHLEVQSDEDKPQMISGDVIAAEFQRYLRRQQGS